MKQKQFLVIMVIILIGIAVSGAKCNLPSKKADPDDKNSLGRENFRTGTIAITMKWIRENMPDVIYDTDSQDEIKLLVEVRNEGADYGTPTDVYLHFGGFDNTYVHLPYKLEDLERDDALEGKSIRNEDGDYRILEIPGTHRGDCGGICGTIDLPQGVDVYRPKFMLTACYKYKTIASPMVCVDPKPYDETADKACRAEDVSDLGGSQGAPIAVTRVDVKNIPNEVIFKVEISNSGKGMIYDKGAVRECPNLIGYEKPNMVDFELDFQGQSTRGGDGWDCNPKNHRVRLVNNKGVIVCTKSVRTPPMSAFQTPLKITLEYGYAESISEEIEIRRLKV